MKQLFLFLILFIFFTFTKEKIIYKSNNIIDSKKCENIEKFIDEFNSKTKWDYALNAQYCRLNDNQEEEEEKEEEEEEKEEEEEEKEEEEEEKEEEEEQESKLKEDKCCYIGILDNSDWNYFCGKIDSTTYKNKISEYINKLKERQSFKNKFKDIKIDCFSKKIDAMIIILIISMVYLI